LDIERSRWKAINHRNPLEVRKDGPRWQKRLAIRLEHAKQDGGATGTLGKSQCYGHLSGAIERKGIHVHIVVLKLALEVPCKRQGLGLAWRIVRLFFFERGKVNALGRNGLTLGLAFLLRSKLNDVPKEILDPSRKVKRLRPKALRNHQKPKPNPCKKG
jgi:hypothetical protein